VLEIVLVGKLPFTCNQTFVMKYRIAFSVYIQCKYLLTSTCNSSKSQNQTYLSCTLSLPSIVDKC